MALTNRIKIIFETVDVRRATPRWGPTEWTFQATVAGIAVGDPAARFPANVREDIELPEATWSHIVDISALDRIEITFAGTAIGESGNHNLGRVRWILRRFGEQERLLTNRFFTLTVRVEVEIEGAFGDHPDDAIYASRAAGGQTIWTTASGRRMVARLEFCEVRPVMGDWAMPRRPRQPPRAGPAVRNGQGRRRIQPGDPINFIRNPSVIPILTAAEANDRTAACIEWTYYRPRALQFTDNDDRLRWSGVPPGRVEFVGGDRGRIIHVRGVNEGEVALECRMEGVVLATYRALVRRIRDIPCRFNILNGPPGSRPRSTPQDVQNHMRIANIFLRQIGLQLIPNNDAPTDGAAAVPGFPGIFRIAVAPGTTVNVQGDHPLCTRLNFRPNVLNIAYIHSDFWMEGGVPQHGLGMTSDYSGNTLVGAPPNHRIEDIGTPSTSWIMPSGIRPDGPPRTVRMGVFRSDWRRHSPAAGPDYSRLFAFYVTSTGNGNPSSGIGMLTYAGTIAHELGHVLTLRHRIGDGDDGLRRPPGSNLMHGDNPSTLAQDLDIIQARAVLGCPVVRPPAAAAPAAPAPAAPAAPAGP